MDFEGSLAQIKGVGPKLEGFFTKLGVDSILDLLWYLPRRYDDFSEISEIDNLEPGMVTIRGQVTDTRTRLVRRGMHITEATVSDDSGSVLVTWFNQPYRSKAMKPGIQYFFSGEFGFYGRKYSISNPTAEAVSDFQKNTARIVPVYPTTKGLSVAQIRKVVAECRPEVSLIKEELPDDLVARNNLMSLSEALLEAHFPSSAENLKRAKHRLAFDELFSIIFAAKMNKSGNDLLSAPSLGLHKDQLARFVANLSFRLTDAQKRAAWKCMNDMTLGSPMNRLLEGDVGSGKTVVAAMLALQTHLSSHQSLVMAPTDILAKQHFKSFSDELKDYDVTVGELRGSMTAKDKSATIERLASGEIDLLVSTHSALEDRVKFKSLAFVVIDEQHRFGVDQRQKISSKRKDGFPHLLSMTATPIPRSLALTIFGELDISVLNEMPEGRKPVDTTFVSPNSKDSMYTVIKEQLAEGRQAFFVYPLIEESENLAAADATRSYQKLKNNVFKEYTVGLIHGRMPTDEKDSVMNRFVAGKIDVLVSTSVVEVGVNVTNASVMVVESAERFGLAQLHQLRGRVGRADHQSYCYVVPTSSKSAQVRLKRFTSINNGFELAELDLDLRGAGEIYGANQHGALDLRVASFADTELIVTVREQVDALVDSGFNLLNYPRLNKRIIRLRTMTKLN